jgi:ribosomal RNA-processing protein 12
MLRQTLPEIVDPLLSLPRLGNSYLSHSAYSIISDLFTVPADNEHSNAAGQVPEILKVILSSPPSKSDKTIPPAWLQVVGATMLAYHHSDPDSCAAEFEKVWNAVWPFVESTSPSTRTAAAHSLDLLAQCITPALITAAVKEGRDDPKSTLGSILVQCTHDLDSLAYVQVRATPEVLAVISSLITNLRHRESRSAPTAAELLLVPTIHKIGDLRISKGFEYKEAADATLATAMRIVGPEVLLRILPLNVENAER